MTFEPAAPLPDPYAASGPTRWLPPAQDYPAPEGGVSTWMAAAGEPAGLPAALSLATDRVAWLLAARGGEEAPPAAPPSGSARDAAGRFVCSTEG